MQIIYQAPFSVTKSRLEAVVDYDVVGNYHPIFGAQSCDLGEVVVQYEPVAGFKEVILALINEVLGNDLFGVAWADNHKISITYPREAGGDQGG